MHLRWYWLLCTDSFVSLSIIQLETEQNSDFVRVYDGSTADPTKLLAQLSGNLVTGATGWVSDALVYDAYSGSMLVEYTSDVAVDGRGFTANFAVMKGTKSPTAQPTRPSRSPTMPASAPQERVSLSTAIPQLQPQYVCAQTSAFEPVRVTTASGILTGVSGTYCARRVPLLHRLHSLLATDRSAVSPPKV